MWIYFNALYICLQNISDETEDDKSKSISRIQTHYAYDLFYNKQFLESMKEFLKLGTDVYEVIRLFPDLLPQQTKDAHETEATTPKLQDRDLEKGILALIEFLITVSERPELFYVLWLCNCNQVIAYQINLILTYLLT